MLSLAFMFLSIYASLHFRDVLLEDREKSGRHSGIIRLPFHCYVEKDLAKYILFMQSFMGIVIILCSGVMLTLNRFSTSYTDSRFNLQQLVSTEEICQEALDACWDVYTEPAVQLADTVRIKMLDLAENEETSPIDPEFFNSLLDTSFVKAVSVYDRNGECEFTTAEGVGYPLSTDPDSAEYPFWSLMNGDRQYMLTSSDNGQIYCAMRRSDAIGIIVVTYSDQGFSELKQKLSNDSVCANFYYCDRCLFVANHSDPDDNTAYQITLDGAKVTYQAEDFPSLVSGQTYCGFRSFNGVSYFVSGLGDANQSVFIFSTVSEILDGLTKNIVVYMIFLLAVCLLDFLGCAVYATETTGSGEELLEPEAETEAELKQHSHHLINMLKKSVTLTDTISESQRTVWRKGLTNTSCLIIFTFVLDALLNENTMFAFLFDGPWEKGFNKFALMLIALVILAVYMSFKVLQYLFNVIIDNFPPRYAAPLQMLQSVLKIFVILCLIVYSASKLGIDAATILASVGISGLALGIAAKDTINDMLNGIFIILDGKVHVGDYVTVDGFYGQITKIGIRTTKISRYNQEKSVNNSSMNNVLNYSHGLASVYLSFKVAPETDIDALKKLIVDSSPLFNEACKNRLKGNMIFSGVAGYDYTGIECGCFASVEERYRASSTKYCYQVLVKLLQENNISFGYDTLKEI